MVEVVQNVIGLAHKMELFAQNATVAVVQNATGMDANTAKMLSALNAMVAVARNVTGLVHNME